MEDLIKELDDINEREFMIQMADHLDSSDYRYLDELHQRRMTIKKELTEKYNWKEVNYNVEKRKLKTN